MLLGDHFLTWQVEPHLPSGGCGGRVDCGSGDGGSAIGLRHGEKCAWQGCTRRILFGAGYLGGSRGGCGAELDGRGVLQRVFTGLYFERRPTSQPAMSHQPTTLASHLRSLRAVGRREAAAHTTGSEKGEGHQQEDGSEDDWGIGRRHKRGESERSH